MRPEASLNYPSYLPPAIDLLLLLAVALVHLFRSGWIYKVSAWIEARLENTKPSPGKLFVAGCLVHLITLAFVGTPQPWVSDEQAYLLGAETFASGRLTNPLPLIDPELDKHFAQDHVLSTPTRQSKYPPGQSLFLALGVFLGHPAFTLVMAAGILTASIAWCLAAVLSRSMAAFGALTSLFWVSAGSYWNHSYWGGSLAAIGGALVLGSYLRLRSPIPKPRPRRAILQGLLLGLGVTILSISRPFEGLAYSVPIAGALVIGLVTRRTSPRSERKQESTTLVIAGITAFIGLLGLGLYNQTVTGNPLTLPHHLYTRQGALGEHHFQWTVAGNHSWLQQVPRIFMLRASLTSWFLLGTPLTLAFIFGVSRGITAPLRKPTTTIPSIPLTTCTAAVFAVLVAQSLAVPWFPHYPSPATAGMLLISLIGLQALDPISLFGRSWKAPLLVAAALCAIVGCVVRLPAHRLDEDSEIAVRQTFIEQLTSEGGQHLVLVDPAGQKNGFWVHNLADPLGQTVLWARSLGTDTDQRLVTRLERQTWRLRFDRAGYQLVPYQWAAPE